MEKSYLEMGDEEIKKKHKKRFTKNVQELKEREGLIRINVNEFIDDTELSWLPPSHIARLIYLREVDFSTLE